MRIFAIKDESLVADDLLGYLIYYESARAFYIELPENIDPWNAPLLLSSFLARGETSIGSYWSRIWVQQRIVPQDRQNIGSILKENLLDVYDEFSLLMLTMGRCPQDDCYLEEISPNELPELLLSRWQYKVDDVVPMDECRLLVFFRNGEVKIIDTKEMDMLPNACDPFLVSQERFNTVEVQTDGYGVKWNDQAVIPDRILYGRGEPVPLSIKDFISFIQHRIVNSSEACAILGCSRQNIDDLMKRGKLHAVRRDERNKLFLKNEVLQRKRASE